MKQKLHFGGVFLLFLCFSYSLTAQSVFINEIHYDNDGADTGEAVEIAGPAGTDLSEWSIVLYNGSNNAPYGTISLDGTIPDQQGGFGAKVFSGPSIQNGAPDGLALIDATGQVVQFLSYEGTITAVDGPASGMTSTDINISQDGSDPVGHSLQLSGEGNQYQDFTWQEALENTFGAVNTNQVLGTPEEILFINEIHYDNASTDTGEAIEVAGTAGVDLSAYSLVLYNGSNGAVYNTKTLTGTIPDQDNGFGTAFFPYPSNGIQNGYPDGIALVKGEEVIQFLSYEGTFTAVGGPADGMSSEDIDVSQTGSEPAGHSLQLTGTGKNYADFAWNTAAENTFGAVNTAQSFGAGTPEPQPEPELPPAPAVDVVFINEIHYDNASGDAGEGVEIAGTAGTDLTGYSLILYNGSATQLKTYMTSTLSGVIPEKQNSYGTIFFPISGIQNGHPDGIALVSPEGELLQFLSYGGSFTPTDGPAAGIESTDIGVTEGGSTPVGFSLQLTGEGSFYKDFSWAAEAQNTYGEVNNGQTFLFPEPVLFINEFHYDTEGTDAGEGIEVAGTAGLDLSAYSIIFYNGANGEMSKTQTLSGILPNQQSGFGTMEFFVSGIQNGAPDGFALVKGDEVLQFLSYEGIFIAVNGPAIGLESTDIGVTESNSTTQAGTSLQLGGVGFQYDDFTWQESLENTFGAVNTNQTFGTKAVEPEPEPEVPAEEGTIAYARAAEVGTKLIVEGTLTVTDHHGNTAFIQDETGGMAIYGNLVTEAGKFQIGDSIRVTGTRAVYNELIQISDVEAVENLGVANEPIEPKEINLAELENHRGQLVKIMDMTFPDPGQLFFGNANYLVSDASGSAELRIDSDVAGLVGKVQPETCAEVIGVVGRYNDINQLLPRMLDDLPCAEEFDPSYPGMDISKDLTFEAVAWNIEWFGDEENAPSAGKDNSDEIQKEAVKAALLRMDADVIAVNEISDDVLFGEMVSEMEGYGFILSEATSYPDEPGGQKVGFVYKTATVDVTNSRPMFTSVHPFYDGDGSLLQDYPESPDRFYASGRLPFLMEAKVTIAGETKEMKFIALHARANSSSGSQSRYDMRKYDVEVLKDSLDHHFANDSVMIMGDYNDDLDYTVANVSTTVTTYDKFVQDDENYSFPTLALSEAGYRTYVVGNYNDMIDHIMVTDELDATYMEGSARVHYELYNLDYSYTTSDHFPISVRLVLSELKVSSVETSGTICAEGDIVSATVTAEGGIAPYTYSWSDGQETATATGLVAGSYTVEVIDALGKSVTSEVIVERATPILITMPEDQTVFSGYETTCTSLSAVSITGGSGEFTYEWSTGDTSEVIEVCPSETTKYTLTITDINTGCTSEASVSVIVEDVSCGKKGDKVLLCHNGKSICVAPQAVPALLNIGATFGSCEDEALEVAIEEVAAWPNPTFGEAQVRVTSAKAFSANLVIYDLNGSPLSKEEIRVNQGATDFPLNLQNLPKGIYLVKILADGFESHGLKLIKE